MSDTSQNKKLALRKKKVMEFCQQMQANGYILNELTVSTETANSVAVIASLPFIILYVVAFGCIAGWKEYMNVNMGMLGTSVFVSIVIHELIHGFFFGLFAPHKFRSVEFGIFWKSLNPYCYCSEPVSKVQYLTALTMPGILLGAVVGTVALGMHSSTWLLFSLVEFLMASGDFFVAFKIFRFGKQGDKALFQDHPDLPGLLVFTKKEGTSLGIEQ